MKCVYIQIWYRLGIGKNVEFIQNLFLRNLLWLKLARHVFFEPCHVLLVVALYQLLCRVASHHLQVMQSRFYAHDAPPWLHAWQLRHGDFFSLLIKTFSLRMRKWFPKTSNLAWKRWSKIMAETFSMKLRVLSWMAWLLLIGWLLFGLSSIDWLLHVNF